MNTLRKTAGLVALICCLGIFNWTTSLCCGHSVFLCLISHHSETCHNRTGHEHHFHSHGKHNHGQDHSSSALCYKHGNDTFTLNTALDPGINKAQCVYTLSPFKSIVISTCIDYGLNQSPSICQTGWHDTGPPQGSRIHESQRWLI